MKFNSNEEFVEYSKTRTVHDEFTVKHPNGIIQLRLCKFFETATQKKVKLLCKVIATSYENCELFQKLKRFMLTEIDFLSGWSKIMANYYRRSHQKVCDTGNLVETKKHPIGVCLSEVELKQAKQDLKVYKEYEKKDMREFKFAVKQSERYKKFFKIVEGFVDKYGFEYGK